MKILLRLLFTFCASFCCTELFAGSLKIYLTPAAAVATGAQWRIDGGNWNPSNATVENLTPGNHTIEYSPVAGYFAPPAETVILVNGLISLLRDYASYPFPPASLQVGLYPSSAQWRIDGGAWMPSSASPYTFAVGNHSIEYSPVTGYATPQSEIVTLISGSNPPIIRSYVPTALAASLKITLNPSTAQWRIDGGTWIPSGSTISNLAIGTHAIDYSAVAGYATPQSETVTLNSGTNPLLIRNYTPSSSAASLKITLSPSPAQWRIDNGAWQFSGVTLSNLALGAHTISYSSFIGCATPLPETITLSSGPNAPLTRSYISGSSAASLGVTLNPSSGLWRIDGGTWTSSGSAIADLALGVHTISYCSVPGYATPPSEIITLVSGSNAPLIRNYTPSSSAASLEVVLNPYPVLWRIDSGTWMSSGPAPISNLTPGKHTIDYSPIAGWATPPSEIITLVSGSNPTLTRNYTPSSSAVSIGVTLNPLSAQWRIDGGTWLSSGATFTNLAPGTHTISYSSVTGYAIPLSETVVLSSGLNLSLTRNYASSSSAASIGVTLNPPSAQWRLDGGAWKSSGGNLGNLAPGTHTLEYAPLPGYVTPPPETVTFGSGSNTTIFRSFALLADLYVVLNPSWALWRIDGGPWLPSDTMLRYLTLGSHAIEYSAVSGYATPPSETINLISGPNPTVVRNYAPLATFSVTLNPAYSSWRLDGGNWNPSGSSLLNLPLGPHSVEYATMPGFITPPTETVTLISGPNPPLNRNYTALATISVSLDPASAQWRLDGGMWNASGTSLSNLTLGTHSVEYSAVTGFITPPAETATLISGLNPLNRSYAALATISVSLDPASAQWRLDGGAWNASGSALSNLSLGTHAIEYSTVAGYITPPAESIVLASGSNPVSRAYALEPPPYTTVKNFDDSINSPVTVSDDNTLYGTTSHGGNFGWGTIFKINQDGTGYSILHDFLDYGDGIVPTGRLTKGNDGRLYGITSQGNPAVGGTLFRIGNTAASYELIHSFGYDGDGSRPSGGVIQGSDGQLYGTTAAGGSNGQGTVYVTSPDGWAYSIIHSFTDGTADDYYNYPTVTEGTDGRLYGTTTSGGFSYAGTVFMMNKDGTGYSILHHFGNQVGNGAYPNAALIQGSDGLFYGTTNYGGTGGVGTVFRMNPDGSGFSVIKNFLGGLADGSRPDHAGVVERNGVLYGVTAYGGTFDAGILYSVKMDGTDFQVLVNLGAGQADGASPEASLTLTPEGILFGTTAQSGSGGGTLFRFRP